MNSRIVRNGLLSLALCLSAVLLPPGKSEAQTCSPACQACIAQLPDIQNQCFQACVYGGFPQDYCWSYCHYQVYVVYATNVCQPM